MSEETVFLVDRELDHVINYGTLSEMIQQLDQSYGNLFVVSYQDLTSSMKAQVPEFGSA
jgi:hypothetical protein